ncbi:MAG: lysophospholipid acyltransferase family protein [Phycisphaerales bacterium]
MTLWIGISVALIAFAFLVRWALRPAIRDGDTATTIVYRMVQIYARVMHRLRVRGAAFAPERGGPDDRPVLVVANHTAGVDPLLIQAALPWEVRWVMALDMRLPALGWLWEFGRVIFVDRGKSAGAGVREAIRHLESGGVLGLFPEGGLERPPRQIMPFQHGVGVMIRRTQPLVLPVIVDGAPIVNPAWASLWHTSSATVRFLPTIDYADSGMGPSEIADDLRRRFADATGWPMNDADSDASEAPC